MSDVSSLTCVYYLVTSTLRADASFDYICVCACVNRPLRLPRLGLCHSLGGGRSPLLGRCRATTAPTRRSLETGTSRSSHPGVNFHEPFCLTSVPRRFPFAPLSLRRLPPRRWSQLHRPLILVFIDDPGRHQHELIDRELCGRIMSNRLRSAVEKEARHTRHRHCQVPSERFGRIIFN